MSTRVFIQPEGLGIIKDEGIGAGLLLHESGEFPAESADLRMLRSCMLASVIAHLPHGSKC